jgi:MoaA/NifB/PqqE/SkfB family radical SAM enzyme
MIFKLLNAWRYIKFYAIYFSSFDPGQLWRIVKCNALSIMGFCRLKKIFICPSHECNADCVHCYEKFLHKNFQKNLSTAAVKDIIDQFCELGGYGVNFCSGEFLMLPEAMELIRYARSKSMVVTVVSNGILLDEKKIDELISAGLSVLVVSIDSADPGRHDKLRGVEGCFEKAVNALRLARKKGLAAMIWTYATKSNSNELQGVIKLGESLGGIQTFVYLPLLSGHLFHRFEENFTFQERQSLRNKFNPLSKVLLEFTSEDGKCRGGGNEHICIMPSGDATFCPPVAYSYGNVAHRPLKSLLKDIRKDHRRFSHCRGQCIVNFPEYRQRCSAKFMYDQ